MCVKNASAGHAATLKGKQILIVEDEALVAILMEDELRNAGAEVVGPVASVGEALRLIDKAAFNGALSAAVLDVSLAGELVDPVADRLASLGVPFVFATGYSEGFKTAGHAAPVLHKPFDPSHLVAAIEALEFAHG